MGVLGGLSTENREFTDADVDFLRGIANVLGSAIDDSGPTYRHRNDIDIDEEADVTGPHRDEQRVHRALETASEGISLLDENGEDLVGQTVWSAFPDATAAFEAEFRRALANQDPVSFETSVRSLDAWFEVNAYPSETGLSVYFRDVTGRKETERELRETNRTLRRLYEITADGDRTFEEKVERLLELGRDRLGLGIGFVAHVDPDEDRFEVLHATGDDERIRPGATAPLSETYCQRTIRSDGSLVLVDTPPRDVVSADAYERWDFDAYAGGTVSTGDGRYGTLCFADEESRSAPFTPAERSFLELATQWLGYELERRHRQEELETLVSDLETSNERLEQFAYAANHDLQEPLRMISSYLRLIERRYADALDDDGAEFLAYAVDGADRMREMIDGLLAYSRIETRGDPLEPVDLDRVVADVLDDLALRIEETDADVTVDVDSLPSVEGDVSQLRQVFQNLLNNALTYSGDGPPRVSIDVQRRESEWLVAVRDEGIGIDPADQDRVFEVFDRLHSREEYDGAGIGLALCERIVERHDGDIWIDSEPGEGSTFSFTLPAA